MQSHILVGGVPPVGMAVLSGCHLGRISLLFAQKHLGIWEFSLHFIWWQEKNDHVASSRILVKFTREPLLCGYCVPGEW